MDSSEDLRRTYRETAIVCGAMVASVLIYAVVVEVLRTQRPPGGVGAGANLDLFGTRSTSWPESRGLRSPSSGGPSRRGLLLGGASSPGCGRALW
jgi:hypothetical protein